MTRGKKLVTLCLSVLLAIIAYINAYANMPVIACPNNTTPEQAVAFLNDRNASNKMIDCIPFIYEYCEEVGIDATIIVGISSIETGYGKSRLFVRNNNPGGMKARRGWMKFDTPKDGYRYMINKIATMAGVRKSKSFYYNSCYYVRDLGNVYWVENGCDRGYYHNLVLQMNKIASYEIEEPIKPIVEVEKIKEHKQTPREYLESIAKSKKKKGLDLIYNAIERK